MRIEISQELPQDYRAAEAMTRRAFFNKYNPGCNEHLLVHKVRQHEDYLPQFSRVALVDGQVAGLIMYTKARIITDHESREVVTFGPLCADHRYKNHGIGRKLLEATLPLVKAAGYPGVLIMGEPEYYPKFGFQRARDFGLTTMDGGAWDAFMGYELTEGGLHLPGGRFQESPLFETLTDEELAVFDQGFDFLAKTVRPCQWGYDHAADEQQGYHVESAINHPREFIALYRKYVQELAAYDPSMQNRDADESVRSIWDNVCLASFVLYAEGKPMGLMVTSAPETPEEAAQYSGFLDALFVDAPYRGRGIGSDAVLRYFRQQTGNAGYCVSNRNPHALHSWQRLLKESGLTVQQLPKGDGYSWFTVSKG